jgi:hypothetical protein
MYNKFNNSDHKIEEGEVYTISNFQVVDNKESYRVINHAYMINFQASTTIVKQPQKDYNIPFVKFEFLEFEDADMRANKVQILSDVIGRLIGIAKVEDVYCKGKLKNKRVIKMENQRGEIINITLWGEKVFEVP